MSTVDQKSPTSASMRLRCSIVFIDTHTKSALSRHSQKHSHHLPLALALHRHTSECEASQGGPQRRVFRAAFADTPTWPWHRTQLGNIYFDFPSSSHCGRADAGDEFWTYASSIAQFIMCDGPCLLGSWGLPAVRMEAAWRCATTRPCSQSAPGCW